MHVLNQVQRIYIQVCQPLHHIIIALHYLVIIQVLGGNRTILRTYLLTGLLVNTAVDCVKQAFCKVCASSEELHLLTGLCCGYTAADRVIIAPYRLHGIIVLILYRACVDGDLRSVSLEVLRQSG